MKVEWLGNDLKLLGDLPGEVTDAFAAAGRPAVIVGPGALAGGGLGAALALVGPLQLIREGWNGFNVVHTSASRMASLILGYAQPGGIADIEAAAPELVLLLGADEVADDRFEGVYKVYIGHHGDAGARQAASVAQSRSFHAWIQRRFRLLFSSADIVFSLVWDLAGTLR